METRMSPSLTDKTFWRTQLKCAEINGLWTWQSRMRQTYPATGRASQLGGSPSGLSLIKLPARKREGACSLQPGPSREQGWCRTNLPATWVIPPQGKREWREARNITQVRALPHGNTKPRERWGSILLSPDSPGLAQKPRQDQTWICNHLRH